MMKTHDFQQLVDEELAQLTWEKAQKEQVLQKTVRPAVRPGRCIRCLALTVLCLMLCAAASAAIRPAVIRYLVGNQAASRMLEETVQPVYAQATADGVTVRITGVICDGEDMVLSYEVENAEPDRPALVALDAHCVVDGREVFVWGGTGIESARMSPSPHLDVLPVKRNPFEDGCRIGTLPEGLQGDVECVVTFRVYRPEKGLAVMAQERVTAMETETDAQYRAELQDSIQLLQACRDTVIIPEEKAAVQAWREKGYTILHASGTLMAEDNTIRETGELQLSFPVDVQEAFVMTHADEMTLADGTVCLERLRLSPLSTTLQMTLIPAENTEAAARALAERCGGITLTDEKNQDVTYADMDYMLDQMPRVRQKDGQWTCAYSLEMPGLQEYPESIGVCIGGQELWRFPCR